jgi:hypothetical protein
VESRAGQASLCRSKSHTSLRRRQSIPFSRDVSFYIDGEHHSRDVKVDFEISLDAEEFDGRPAVRECGLRSRTHGGR